jgi:hypothetical protein
VPKEINLYDLVEREAARSGVPRMALWQSVAKALVERDLPVSSNVVSLNWLAGFKAAVDRYNEPNSGVIRHLKQIFVRAFDFKKWRQHGFPSRTRGPRQNTTGYQTHDRKLFRRINELRNSGKARSPYDAALQLAKANEVAPLGATTSPESKAKRLSARYRKENPATR